MRKTRRHQFDGGRTPALDVALALIVCALIACAGVGYVWQKEQINLLGKKTKRLENRIDELKRREEGLRRQEAVLCTDKKLEERLRELRLGLAPPQPDQIVRLPDGFAGAGWPGAQSYTAQK